MRNFLFQQQDLTSLGEQDQKDKKQFIGEMAESLPFSVINAFPGGFAAHWPSPGCNSM